jgi:nucleotide-binding universal stress UspA family protein
MRWIVDVNLRAPSQGAIRFATSLGRGSAGTERFVPVHVLEQDHLRSALRLKHLDEVVDEARGDASRMLGEAAASESFGEVEVVQALYEEEGLAATREKQEADAVIVGRNDHRILRLGRVARRLLINPPCPVVVVPANLADGAQLDGPVVALTDLRAHSVEAYRFAARLARQSGRELTALHIVAGEGEEVDEGDLREWVAGCGLPADRHVVARGEVVREALALADAARALVLVTGSRPRTGLDRVLGRSIGRALAARATRPVAVVPSAVPRREVAAETSGARAPLHA